MATQELRFTVAPAAPPTTRGPLSVSLKFADGKTIDFHETGATDIGTYHGEFVHQRCLRQRAAGNGDYRDAFVVFFRPDEDGMRDEVVVEYGTEYDLSAGPRNANNVSPYNLFVPPLPTLSKTTGSSSSQTGAILVYMSYAKGGLEGATSWRSSITIAASERVVVTSPAAAGGATGYYVYTQIGGGSAIVRQTATPVPLGSDWAAPATGLLTSGTAPPDRAQYPAYTATIDGGVGPPVTVDVVSHWWGARWRWQSAPRPLVRSAADVVAMKATFPIDASLRYGAALPAAKTWGGPMDSGGLYVGMPDTGDRADIGPVTEWIAAWLATGNSAAEISWRAGAEATGTMPFGLRDVATGAPPDAIAHPFLAWNDAGGGGYKIPAVPAKARNFFTLDQSHMPAAGFIPWLLTDDPYFLEGAQFQAHYSFMESNYYRLPVHENLPTMASRVQPRAWAWSVRDMLSMSGFAPEQVPQWLKSRSYWESLIPDTLTYVGRYMNATASPCTTVFGIFPNVGFYQTFMTDFQIIVASWAVWTGLHSPEWRGVLEYISRPRMATADNSGASGWDYRMPTPYLVNVIDARLGAASTGGPAADYHVTTNINTPESWGELWTCYKAWAASGKVAKWKDPSTWAADTVGEYWVNYMPEARASLAALSLAGVDGAASRERWLRDQLTTKYPTISGAQYKWGIKNP